MPTKDIELNTSAKRLYWKHETRSHFLGLCISNTENREKAVYCITCQIFHSFFPSYIKTLNRKL